MEGPMPHYCLCFLMTLWSQCHSFPFASGSFFVQKCNSEGSFPHSVVTNPSIFLSAFEVYIPLCTIVVYYHCFQSHMQHRSSFCRYFQVCWKTRSFQRDLSVARLFLRIPWKIQHVRWAMEKWRQHKGCTYLLQNVPVVSCTRQRAPPTFFQVISMIGARTVT